MVNYYALHHAVDVIDYIVRAGQKDGEDRRDAYRKAIDCLERELAFLDGRAPTEEPEYAG